MTIVHIPRRQRQEYRVNSVTAQRPVAMTMERLNGLGETQTIVTTVEEKVDWKTVLAVAIPLAILIPILIAALTGEKAEQK